MGIKENDFEINIDNINVEEIMTKIRQNIKDKGYVEEEKINNFDVAWMQYDEFCLIILILLLK